MSAQQHFNEAAREAKDTARDIHDSKPYRMLVRFGLLSYGIVHLLLGWLAAQVALGGGGEDASQSGALQSIAQQGALGKALMWAVTVGFAVITLWQLFQAAMGHTNYDGFKRTRKRLSSVGRAIIYGVLGFQSATLAMGGSSGQSGQTEKGLTATILGWPFGQALVFIIGLAVIAVGVYHIVKGVTDRWEEDLDGGIHDAGEWAARVGHAAKGVAIVLVGSLFCWAAITYDANASGGMDQALQTLKGMPAGVIVLLLVAVGLAAYGVYCFFWAKHPKFR